MESLFSARFLTFDHESWSQPTTLRHAAEWVRDGKVAAVLLDVVPESACHHWWMDNSTTGGTTLPGRPSATPSFTQWFVDELGADRQTFSAWNRFMLAAKHAYPLTEKVSALATGDAGVSVAPSRVSDLASAWRADANDDEAAGATPVVDARLLTAGAEPIAAFLTIRPGTRASGLRLWNSRATPTDARNPWSQPDNRGPHWLNRPTASEGIEAVTICPTAGQLCLFNSAKQHAWETSSAFATSSRVPQPSSAPVNMVASGTHDFRARMPRTPRIRLARATAATSRLAIHAFLVHHQDGWTLLQ